MGYQNKLAEHHQSGNIVKESARSIFMEKIGMQRSIGFKNQLLESISFELKNG